MLTSLMLCVLLSPQAPPVTSVPVPECRTQLFAVAWPIGLDHDDDGKAGLAQVRAELALAMAAPTLPKDVAMAATCEVFGTATLFFAAVPVAEAEAGFRWAAALLAPGTPSPDTAALVVARAALASDDAEFLYPGPQLRSRLCRTLFAGDAAGRWERGEPAQMQSLLGSELLPADFPPVGSQLLVIGGAEAAALAAGEPQLVATRRQQPVPARVVRTMPPVGESFTRQSSVGGPYVAAAHRAPPTNAAEAPAFALAIEVLRLRAARVFADRRSGLEDARAPAVHFEWLAGDAQVVITRRGRDGVPVEAPRREVDNLLADLRRPATDSELAAARQALAQELLLPPWPDDLLATLRAVPPALRTRARVLLLARLQGLGGPGTTVAAVEDAAVRAILTGLADPVGWAFAGLLPTFSRPLPK